MGTINYSAIADNSTGGTALFSLVSTGGGPITKLTITSPNAGLNGWDFFVDNIVLTPGTGNAVPEPSSFALLSSLGVVFGAIRGLRKKMRD